MTLRSYKLAINKPCEENWLDMTTNEQGKYCAQCCKTVIDFSILSDDEIVKVLNNSSGELCGRLSPQQLNREIHNSAKTTPITYNWWYNVASSILLLVTAKQAEAKAPELIANQHITQQHSLTTPAITTTDSITINGKVVDESGEPVPFGNVVVADNMKYNTQTDFNGEFKLIVPNTLVQKEIKLRISSVGFALVEKTIAPKKTNSSVNITLVSPKQFVGDIVIVVKEKKKSKRWQFWKRN
ncbi:MAG: carboxypeptidase-like regulatory domain-containing protein [Bacteroidia bacterium]